MMFQIHDSTSKNHQPKISSLFKATRIVLKYIYKMYQPMKTFFKKMKSKNIVILAFTIPIVLLASVITIVFFIFFSFLHYQDFKYGPDGLPSEYTDLITPDVQKISENRNAFFDLEKITNDISISYEESAFIEDSLYYLIPKQHKLKNSSKTITSSKDLSTFGEYSGSINDYNWYQENTNKLLEANKSSLQYFYDASKKTSYQSPYISENNENYNHICVYNWLLNIQRIVLLDAMNDFQKEKKKQAIDKIIQSIKVGKLLATGKSVNNTHTLIGIVMMGKSYSLLNKMIAASDFETNEYIQIKQKIAQMELSKREQTSVIKEIVQKDYQNINKDIWGSNTSSVTLNTPSTDSAHCTAVLNTNDKNTLNLKKMGVMKILSMFNFPFKKNDSWNAYITDIEKNKEFIGTQEFITQLELRLENPSETTPKKSIVTAFVSENTIGKAIIHEFRKTVIHYQKSMLTYNILNNSIQFQTILQAHKKIHGSYPKKTTDIDPTLRLHIPIDPSTGKYFIYTNNYIKQSAFLNPDIHYIYYFNDDKEFVLYIDMNDIIQESEYNN
ncbi:MAG: hypothetical protein P1V18_05510 [Candidatus Gracilibacteria bacterium]|nr:hypothetical protein [Candidatus Gracilibacteria bacterium]